MLKPERKPMLGVVSARGAGNMFRDTLMPGEEMESARILPVDLIDPNPGQVRKDFNPEALDELAKSIQEQGLLQPIVVRPWGEGRYQIVAGERRYRASIMAGKGDIAAIIREMTDEQAYIAMAVENLQRRDLTIVEEVKLVAVLARDQAVSGRRLAESLHKGKDWVARRLALVEYPELLARVSRGEINLIEAMSEIARLKNPEIPVKSVSPRDTKVVGNSEVSIADSQPDDKSVSWRDTPEPTFTARVVPQGGLMPVNPDTIDGIRYSISTDAVSAEAIISRLTGWLSTPDLDDATRQMVRDNLKLISYAAQQGLKEKRE